jgi:hypothetical protein
LVSHGTLRAQFDINGKLDLLDIGTTGHAEYVPRTIIQQQEVDQTKSPKVGKGVNKRVQQNRPQPSVRLPDSMVTDDGVPLAVMSFLEV